MKDKIILRVKGRPCMSEFDKSFYSDDHDVPALYIGGQIMALGYGIEDWNEKDKDHLRWKLDEDKEYIVEIREVENE